MQTIDNLAAAVATMNHHRQRYAIDKNTLAWVNARIAECDKANDTKMMELNRNTRSMLFSNMNRHRRDLGRSIKVVESLRNKGV